MLVQQPYNFSQQLYFITASNQKIIDVHNYTRQGDRDGRLSPFCDFVNFFSRYFNNNILSKYHRNGCDSTIGGCNYNNMTKSSSLHSFSCRISKLECLNPDMRHHSLQCKTMSVLLRRPLTNPYPGGDIQVMRSRCYGLWYCCYVISCLHPPVARVNCAQLDSSPGVRVFIRLNQKKLSPLENTSRRAFDHTSAGRYRILCPREGSSQTNVLYLKPQNSLNFACNFATVITRTF